jgi:hypothetical protein
MFFGGCNGPIQDMAYLMWPHIQMGLRGDGLLLAEDAAVWASLIGDE